MVAKGTVSFGKRGELLHALESHFEAILTRIWENPANVRMQHCDIDESAAILKETRRNQSLSLHINDLAELIFPLEDLIRILPKRDLGMVGSLYEISLALDFLNRSKDSVNKDRKIYVIDCCAKSDTQNWIECRATIASIDEIISFRIGVHQELFEGNSNEKEEFETVPVDQLSDNQLEDSIQLGFVLGDVDLTIKDLLKLRPGSEIVVSELDQIKAGLILKGELWASGDILIEDKQILFRIDRIAPETPGEI